MVEGEAGEGLVKGFFWGGGFGPGERVQGMLGFFVF